MEELRSVEPVIPPSTLHPSAREPAMPGMAGNSTNVAAKTGCLCRGPVGPGNRLTVGIYNRRYRKVPPAAFISIPISMGFRYFAAAAAAGKAQNCGTLTQTGIHEKDQNRRYRLH
jgi:hypothetical protein